MVVLKMNSKNMIVNSKIMQIGMRLFKMRCKWCFLLLPIICILTSCGRDIDAKIKDCYNANDTIFWMSDLYPEAWDTLYFISGDPSLKEVENRLGPNFNYLTIDTGDKMLLVNSFKKVLYYKEWEMIYDQKIDWPIFVFESESKIMVIPRDSAQFLIRKRDDDSYWVYWIGK